MQISTLKIPPRAWRRGRPKVKPLAPSHIGPLTLVSATYQPGTSVTLVFDRAIDISAYDGEQVFVDDGVDVGDVYLATGTATLLSPTTLRVMLNSFAPSVQSTLTLTAPATTGIAAAEDGALWAGVTAMALPYP